MNLGEGNDAWYLSGIWVSPEEDVEWSEFMNEQEDITLPEFYELKESPITMHQLHYISNKKNNCKKQKVVQHDISVLEDQHPPSQEIQEDHVVVDLEEWIHFPNHDDEDDEPIENKDNGTTKKRTRSSSTCTPLNEHDMNATTTDIHTGASLKRKRHHHHCTQ